MKNYLLLLLLLQCAIFTQTNPYKTNENEPILARKISHLEETSQALRVLHDQMANNSAELQTLHQESTKYLRDRMYEVYVEGSMNLIDKLSTPFNSVIELAVDVVMEFAIQDPIWSGTSRKEDFAAMKNSMNYRNTKLRIMYETLGKLIDYPLDRFDDDKKPLPFTSSWWKTGDNEKDDELELSIRKLNVISNLSELVYKKTEEELQKIRDERRVIQEELTSTKTDYELAKEQNEKAGQKTNELRNAYVSAKNLSSTDSRGEGIHEGPRPLEADSSQDPPQLKEEMNSYRESQRELEAERQRLAEERRARELAFEQKLEEATVYIDSDCSRYVYQFEKTRMLAKSHPEDIKGTFKLKIDDKQVNFSREKNNFYSFEYMFIKPGVYDVQVELYVNNKYIDTYTDQWYVEEKAFTPPAGMPFPRYAEDNRPNYDSRLEGTTKPVMKNQYVNYVLLYEGGDIYLTGYYYTPSGQKVDYKSKPLAAQLENAPVTGLVLTRGGTGYHIYQTTGETTGGVPYVITRLRGTEITVIKEFKAAFFTVKNAPDYSSFTVEYKETSDGTLKMILLD